METVMVVAAVRVVAVVIVVIGVIVAMVVVVPMVLYYNSNNNNNYYYNYYYDYYYDHCYQTSSLTSYYYDYYCYYVYYYYYFPHHHHYHYHDFGLHTQVVCLLQFGFSDRLLELYIQVASDNHLSQRELATTVSESASAKRARLEEEMSTLRTTRSPNSGVMLAALQREHMEIQTIIGVGKHGGHRDQAPAAKQHWL